jgi:hypothetical protein
MAKIHEEALVIKLSKIFKDNDDATSALTADTIAAIEQVVQELVGSDVIVEIELA